MITKEKLKNRISFLQEKHDILDKQVQELYEHHGDCIEIEMLKKHKLQIKDEIVREQTKLSQLGT